MESIRRINRQTLLVWCLLLSLLLLCAQGVTMHIHIVDHAHDKYLDHSHFIGETSDHSHISKAHLSNDTFHNDHHNEAVTEIDVTPEGVLKNLSNNIIALALFALLLILVLPITSRQVRHRIHKNPSTLYHYYLISPPLRAPPQH